MKREKFINCLIFGYLRSDRLFFSRFGDPFDHLRDFFGDGFGRFRQNRDQNIFHKQVSYSVFHQLLVPWFIETWVPIYSRFKNIITMNI